MTARYGIYVGAVKQLSPPQQVDSAYTRTFDEILVRDVITFAAAPIADTVEAISNLGWESVLDPGQCVAYWGAMGAATTFTFGDVTFPAAFDTGVAVSAAGKASLLSVITPANYYQPLWQQLGYATLAAAKLVAAAATLKFTLAGGAFTGSLAWRLVGARRI